LTPEVTDVSPAQGTIGDTVTVTGTGFEDSASTFVMIGDALCEPAQATTSTEIVCTLGAGTKGENLDSG